MQTITYDKAPENLKSLVLKAVKAKDETVIASDEESLAALIGSHVIRDKGGRPEGIYPEQAFKDV